MILDFFSKLPQARVGQQLAQAQQALSAKQAKKIAELRSNGFHALARWFRENPQSVG